MRGFGFGGAGESLMWWFNPEAHEERASQRPQRFFLVFFVFFVVKSSGG
jgi:hypothetical protein